MTIQPTPPNHPDHQPTGDTNPPTTWLTDLRTAYAAMNDGNLEPISAMLDHQVHLSGPEHGHLWWTSHRTWNGPDDVRAELRRRSSLDGSPGPKHPASPGADPTPPHDHTAALTPDTKSEPPVKAGEPSPISRRYIATYHAVQPSAHTRERDQRHPNVVFHEVITIRAGKIVLLADYRSQRTARTAAHAAS